MNTPTTQTPDLLSQMTDARTTCRDLLTILIEENQTLSQHKASAVEARLQLKKRLSLRLEKLLFDIKAQRAAIKGNPQAATLAVQLAEEIRVFQDYAVKNVELLKAAHHIRADIVAVIRDTIEAESPKVTTYGRGGAITPVNAGTTVLAREV
jgi:hypothetical protein